MRRTYCYQVKTESGITGVRVSASSEERALIKVMGENVTSGTPQPVLVSTYIGKGPVNIPAKRRHL